MSWMPRGHSVYPCRARPNVICPMRVHSPYIVKSIEMVPSCLIFPLQFECSKISSTSTFNQKRKPSTFNHALYAEVLHVCNARTSSSISFSQQSRCSDHHVLSHLFPSLSIWFTRFSPNLFCLERLPLSLSLSLSLSNLTNSKFPIIIWTIQNLFSLVVLTTLIYLFITFWFLGITTIRFWFRGNRIINRLAWKQITGSAAKVAWGTVLYSVLLLNLVS